MRAGSTFDMVATMRIYEQDLSDLPSDLVCDTIRAFRQGKRGNGRFAPTAAEIGAAAREKLSAREAVQRAREAQEALDRETIAARGSRERAASGRNEDWRERAAREVEALKADLARASGRRAGGALDWVKDVKPRPVENFSDKLAAQLRGELPIGQSGEARPFTGEQSHG